MPITKVQAKKILSSWGNETVEVQLAFSSGATSFASVPAGISAGKYEVKNVPVDEALAQITSITSRIVGVDLDQQRLDKLLVESNLGGNAMLPISAAFWRAQNAGKVVSFHKYPQLLVLVFEGGKHGSPAITMQEFMIVEDTVDVAAADFRKLKTYLESQGVADDTVGAEGGFSPESFTNEKVLQTITSVFPGKKIAIDVAGSFTTGGIDYADLLYKHQVVLIEDPYSDEAWADWQNFYRRFGSQIVVVGDDLTVTNADRITQALKPRVINAVVIKPNQNGTITGTLEAVKLARDNQLAVVVSHRGEETDDTWIADFALAVEADYVKFGGIDRGERIAKYNRLAELGMK